MKCAITYRDWIDKTMYSSYDAFLVSQGATFRTFYSTLQLLEFNIQQDVGKLSCVSSASFTSKPELYASYYSFRLLMQ